MYANDTNVPMSDFAQALSRPEMDEQRYFHSQQQNQLQQRQQYENQVHLTQQQQQQQQQKQQYSWFNTPRNRLSSAGATLMSSSPKPSHQQQQQQQKQKNQSRSFDLKPKGFLSAFMGSFRQHETDPNVVINSNNSRSNRMDVVDDELSRTYHGNADRTMQHMTSFASENNLSTQSRGEFLNNHTNNHHQLSNSEDAFSTRFGNNSNSNKNISNNNEPQWNQPSPHNAVNTKNNNSDKWLNASTHSMVSGHSLTSQGSSEFPIMNRRENVADLGRTRQGERENREMIDELNNMSLIYATSNGNNNINMNSNMNNNMSMSQPRSAIKSSLSSSELSNRGLLTKNIMQQPQSPLQRQQVDYFYGNMSSSQDNYNRTQQVSMNQQTLSSSQQHQQQLGQQGQQGQQGQSSSSYYNQSNGDRSPPTSNKTLTFAVSSPGPIQRPNSGRVSQASHSSPNIPRTGSANSLLKARSPLGIADPDSDPFFTSDDFVI